MADSTLDSQVQLDVKDGVATIEQGTPLTRLHYFDGKFLRADALTLEQDYHRNLVRLSHLAGGWGVVNGLGIALSGDQINLSPGLAITPAGSSVLLTSAASFSVAALIKAASPAPANPAAPNFGGAFNNCTSSAPPSINTSTNTGYYEITAGPIEGLCGNEEVYGKLCETACVSDSQSPFWKEGLVLRLRPIALNLPASQAVPASDGNLRSRVVSAYFAAEPWLTNSLLSSAGLNASTWCNPANLYTRDEVPLGLLVRNGASTLFIDAWSARRERMDTQARGYWQGRMAMRPWNVFLAQILQFQCQLAGLFASTGGVITPANNCDSVRDLLEKTRAELAALHSHYSASTEKILAQFNEKPNKKDAQSIAAELKLSYSDLFDIKQKLDHASSNPALPTNRLLINSGFIQLPPAGYLPVVPGNDTLRKQMERTFGEGVQLSYHAVRHDEIAHLVEEAQHLERISLTRGLDDAKTLEQVQIFVPDGEVYNQQSAAPGIWWQVDMQFAALSLFNLGMDMSKPGTTNLTDTGATHTMSKESAKAEPTTAPVAMEVPAPEAAAPVVVVEPAPTEDKGLEAAKIELSRLGGALTKRGFTGLARTEGRSDGSFGLTLISRLDVADIIEAIRQLVQDYPQLDAKGNFDVWLKIYASLSLYVAGDLAADPLELPIGGSATLSGELILSTATFTINGSLTVLFDRAASGGDTERVAQLKFIFADASGKLSQIQSRISLLKKGAGNSDGELVVDDAEHDPTSSPNFFTWSRNPRKAIVSVLADSKQESISQAMLRRALSNTGETSGEGFKDVQAGAAITYDTADLERKTLATLYGLPAMPEPSSAIGAAALNALIQIADTHNDPAFLARARQRLFPTLDTPATTGVKSVLDWVMFRRARTVLCCSPNTQVASSLEAFQVWHLKVADEGALKRLTADLNNSSPSALAKYKFQRVGVLRYRDANPISEESQAQVLSLWKAANPAAQVALGRYWEQAPSIGQSWQNHSRLANMLDQIASLTTPPERGSMAITRLEHVVPPLAEGGLDGGLLVVTVALTQSYTHRVLLAGVETFEKLRTLLKSSPESAWKTIEGLLHTQSFRQDISITFNGTTPQASDVQKLQDADAAMANGGSFQRQAICISSTNLLPNENPSAQHSTLCTLIRAKKQNAEYSTTTTDLGNGAHTLSVIGYTFVEEEPSDSYGHRVVFADGESFNALAGRAQAAGGASALAQLNLELAQQRHRLTDVVFENGTLLPSSQDDIQRVDTAMRHDQFYTVKALHFDAPEARPGEDFAKQYSAVTGLIKVTTGNDLGGFTANDFDTREDFRVVTLLGYFLVT